MRFSYLDIMQNVAKAPEYTVCFTSVWFHGIFFVFWFVITLSRNHGIIPPQMFHPIVALLSSERKMVQMALEINMKY